MYNNLIRGTNSKSPATSVYGEQQDKTRIAGSVNETEKERETDKTPATITENATGTVDTIDANSKNETTADRPANENVPDENNKMDELTRGRLIARGRLPNASNKKVMSGIISNSWVIWNLGGLRTIITSRPHITVHIVVTCLVCLSTHPEKRGEFHIRVQRN